MPASSPNLPKLQELLEQKTVDFTAVIELIEAQDSANRYSLLSYKFTHSTIGLESTVWHYCLFMAPPEFAARLAKFKEEFIDGFILQNNPTVLKSPEARKVIYAVNVVKPALDFAFRLKPGIGIERLKTYFCPEGLPTLSENYLKNFLNWLATETDAAQKAQALGWEKITIASEHRSIDFPYEALARHLFNNHNIAEIIKIFAEGSDKRIYDTLIDSKIASRIIKGRPCTYKYHYYDSDDEEVLGKDTVMYDVKPEKGITIIKQYVASQPTLAFFYNFFVAIQSYNAYYKSDAADKLEFLKKIETKGHEVGVLLYAFHLDHHQPQPDKVKAMYNYFRAFCLAYAKFPTSCRTAQGNEGLYYSTIKTAALKALQTLKTSNFCHTYLDAMIEQCQFLDEQITADQFSFNADFTKLPNAVTSAVVARKLSTFYLERVNSNPAMFAQAALFCYKALVSDYHLFYPMESKSKSYFEDCLKELLRLVKALQPQRDRDTLFIIASQMLVFKQGGKKEDKVTYWTVDYHHKDKKTKVDYIAHYNEILSAIAGLFQGQNFKPLQLDKLLDEKRRLKTEIFVYNRAEKIKKLLDKFKDLAETPYGNNQLDLLSLWQYFQFLVAEYEAAIADKNSQSALQYFDEAIQCYGKMAALEVDKAELGPAEKFSYMTIQANAKELFKDLNQHVSDSRKLTSEIRKQVAPVTLKEKLSAKTDLPGFEDTPTAITQQLQKASEEEKRNTTREAMEPPQTQTKTRRATTIATSRNDNSESERVRELERKLQKLETEKEETDKENKKLRSTITQIKTKEELQKDPENQGGIHLSEFSSGNQAPPPLSDTQDQSQSP